MAAESFPMIGGDGPYSYSKNSNLQREAAENAKEMMVSAIVESLDIEKALCPFSNSFRIADLGCSTGPNTFIAVQNIIEAVSQKFQTKGQISQIPEFQVYFSDHVSNDFNILFANLPKDGKYFAAGVPGSFHGRLFPRASLSFVYSSYALQWLSKAPQELRDSNSPAFNKGRIFYTNAADEVGEAYFVQYSQDLLCFLDARAQELAPGGLMGLLIPGRPDGTLPANSSLGPIFEPFQSCLVDMANEGLISKDKIDTFNLPMYSPSPEELRKLIQKNGCFEIVKLDEQPGGSVPLPSAEGCRAGLQTLIINHFGSEIIGHFFDRYAKKVEGRPPLSTATDGVGPGLFILLKRNS